jgi:hypothetical protein
MLLKAIQADDEADFLAAVASSRRLHHPWVSPPSTPQAFAPFLSRLQNDVNRGYLVRTQSVGGLVGYITSGSPTSCVGRSAAPTSATTPLQASSDRA